LIFFLLIMVNKRTLKFIYYSLVIMTSHHKTMLLAALLNIWKLIHSVMLLMPCCSRLILIIFNLWRVARRHYNQGIKFKNFFEFSINLKKLLLGWVDIVATIDFLSKIIFFLFAVINYISFIFPVFAVFN